MKFFLTIFLIITFISSSYSKEEITRYEDLVEREGLLYKKFTDVPFSGKIEGFFIDKYYGKSNTFSRGYIENGKRNGDWKYYFYNGNLKSKGKILNNTPVGKWKFYKNNGDLIGISSYNPKTGLIFDGPEVLYSGTKKGNIIRIETIKNGKLEGLQQYFYKDEKGKLRKQFYLKNGKKNGYFSDTYQDTQFLRTRGSYKNGELDGEYITSWNVRGVKDKKRILYKNGFTIWEKFYNEKGHLLKIVKYGEHKQRWEHEKSDKTICEYKGDHDIRLTVTKCYFIEKNTDKIIPKNKNIMDSLH